MAGLLSGLLSGIAGYGQGKKERTKDNAAQTEQAKQDAMAQAGIDERAKVDNASIAANQATTAAANTKAQQDAAIAAQNAGIAAANTKFESGLKLPPGWSKYSDSQKISYLQVRFSEAQANHDDKVADQTQGMINSIALGSQREANATFTSGAKTKVALSQVDVNNARAAADRDLPARARQIAAGHDATSLARAAAEIQGRQELAQFGANARLGLVQLAAAYRAQNNSADNAVRMAIADYNGSVHQYEGAHSAYAAPGSVDPNAPAPTMQMPAYVPPNITLNNYMIDPRTGQVVPAGSRQPGAGVQPLPISQNRGSANPKKVVSLREEFGKLRKAGINPSDPAVRQRYTSSGYSDAEYAAAMQGSSVAAPLPVRQRPAPQPLPILKGVAPQLLGQ